MGDSLLSFCAGQSNYGFANSALDFMCEARLAEGLPALSIQWGIIGHVGFVEEAMQASNASARPKILPDVKSISLGPVEPP